MSKTPRDAGAEAYHQTDFGGKVMPTTVVLVGFMVFACVFAVGCSAARE